MTAGKARIGLNLLWMVPGVVGGSEEYTMRLLAGLSEREHVGLDFVVFANRHLESAYPDFNKAYRVVRGSLAQEGVGRCMGNLDPRTSRSPWLRRVDQV